MPKRNRNTFAAYQEAKQHSREQCITQYLEYLRTSRVKFDHVTGLAEMVAAHLSHQEQKPCNRATLLRNGRYKALLLTFMAAHLGTGIRTLKLNSVANDQAKALVTSAQLEVANLKREVERLKAYVAHLESSPRMLYSEGPDNCPSSSESDFRKALGNVQMKFTRTCQALLTILSNMQQAIAIDMERKQILDRSKLRNDVLVDPTLAGPFIDWLTATRDSAAVSTS